MEIEGAQRGRGRTVDHIDTSGDGDAIAAQCAGQPPVHGTKRGMGEGLCGPPGIRRGGGRIWTSHLSWSALFAHKTHPPSPIHPSLRVCKGKLLETGVLHLVFQKGGTHHPFIFALWFGEESGQGARAGAPVAVGCSYRVCPLPSPPLLYWRTRGCGQARGGGAGARGGRPHPDRRRVPRREVRGAPPPPNPYGKETREGLAEPPSQMTQLPQLK